MHRVFVPIYRFFRSHKALLYVLLALSTLVFVFFGTKLRYEEDVAKLLPRSSVESELAFSDIGLKDKIFIQITSADAETPLDTWTLSDYIDEFTDALEQRDSTGKYIRSILRSLDAETAIGAMDYGFEHLPSLIDTGFYEAFAAALEPAALDAQMARNLELIESDMTGETTRLVCTDPFALRDIFLARLMPEGAMDRSVGDSATSSAPTGPSRWPSSLPVSSRPTRALPPSSPASSTRSARPSKQRIPTPASFSTAHRWVPCRTQVPSSRTWSGP